MTRDAGDLGDLGNSDHPISMSVRPPARDHSLLGIEANGIFAQRVQVAEERVLPAGEGEESDRRGYADVDPNHSCADILSELTRRPAGTRKDGSSIAVFGVADHGQSLAQGLHANDGEHRAEDLFSGDARIGIDVVEN